MNGWALHRDSDGWRPEPDVTNHAGEPLGEGLHYFAPPPGEIGAVISAHSTLTAGQRPWSLPMRFAIAAMPTVVAGAAVAWVQSHYFHLMDEPLRTLIAVGVGVFVFAIIWWVTRFRHTCSYVADLGIARFTAKGDLHRAPQAEILVFADASDLRTEQTRQYYNGVYTGTTYAYTWTNSQGEKLLKISGTYQSKKGMPKAKSPFHFAQAAEAAWNAHLANRLENELAQQGYVQFALNKNESVRVAPGYLEFVNDKLSERLNVEDIKEFSFGSGVFHIQHKDAKRFGRKGKHSFDYGKLSNARMFLVALNTVLGLGFGSGDDNASE